MKIKCICNDNRGTDCDYCGGSGWIEEKVSLGIAPSHEIIAEPEKIWRRITPREKPRPYHRKTIEERISALKTDLNELTEDSIEDSINYLGELLKKLYLDIKKIGKTLKRTKLKKEIYNDRLQQSIHLIKAFDKKFKKHKITI